jgi:hypothetical protein
VWGGNWNKDIYISSALELNLDKGHLHISIALLLVLIGDEEKESCPYIESNPSSHITSPVLCTLEPG